ncbi:hypothetical protein H1R20_g10206, partial [Candolleomyces eurysporus]
MSFNASTQSKPSKSEKAAFPPQTSCHKKYYINGGGPLHFEGTAFFENFVPVGTKLDPNALPGTGGPEKAIIIRTATVEEFCKFLWVFYNEKIDDYSEANLADWFTILRLAHEWGFKHVKTLALRYIKKQDNEIPNVVDRLVAYEKYSPPIDTLLPLYMELIGRDEYPTEAECELLGDHKALKIHRARERLLRASKKAGSGRLDPAQVKAIVVETLGLSGDLAATGTMPFSSKPTPTSSGSNSKDTDGPKPHATKSESTEGNHEPPSVFDNGDLNLKPNYGKNAWKNKDSGA